MKCQSCKWMILFGKGTYDACTEEQLKEDESHCADLNKNFKVSEPPFHFDFCPQYKPKKLK